MARYAGILRRFLWAVALALGTLSLGNCLAADLENGFDLKGPKGVVGYVVNLTQPVVNLFQPAACRFDTGTFDSCSFDR